MDLLEQLARVGLANFRDVLVEEGVSCVADIAAYFSVPELKALGMKTVQAKKAIALGKSADGPAGSEPTVAPLSVPSLVVAPQLPSSTFVSENVRGEGEGPGTEGGGDAVANGDTASTGQNHAEEGEEEAVVCPDSSDVSGKVSKRADLVRVWESGGARYRGATSELVIRGDGSCCAAFLDTLEGKLLPELRSRDERNRVGGSGRKYQYSRLQVGLLENAFDSLGNFCCHSACLVRHFGLSTAVVSRVHKKAVLLARTPTKEMACSEIRRRKLCDRAILPDSNVLARESFFKKCPNDVMLHVVLAGLSSHGLCGKVSNRARVEEMKMFEDFVRSNRSPTGRTPDSHGRYHGAVYTLSPKIVSLRSKEELSLKRKSAGDTRPIISSSHSKEDESLSGRYNKALQEVWVAQGKSFCPVSSSTVCVWLDTLFSKGSPEHTTIHPHKTDACSECEQLTADITSLKSSIKRHSQQEGDMGITRAQDMEQLKDDVKDLEQSQ